MNKKTFDANICINGYKSVVAATFVGAYAVKKLVDKFFNMSVVVLCLTHQETPCSQEPTQGDVKRVYVFTTLNGKAVTLSEQDVFKIVQMNASGVLPSVIAKEFGLSISTVSIIIISITNHKK